MATQYELSICGRTYQVEVEHVTHGTAVVRVDGITYEVEIGNNGHLAAVSPINGTPAVSPSPSGLGPTALLPNERRSLVTVGEGDVVAPLPGLLLNILVAKGERVKYGQTLLQIEAMKMENNVIATRDGVVKEINVKPGQEVQEGELLMVIN